MEINGLILNKTQDNICVSITNKLIRYLLSIELIIRINGSITSHIYTKRTFSFSRFLIG